MEASKSGMMLNSHQKHGQKWEAGTSDLFSNMVVLEPTGNHLSVMLNLLIWQVNLGKIQLSSHRGWVSPGSQIPSYPACVIRAHFSHVLFCPHFIHDFLMYFVPVHIPSMWLSHVLCSCALFPCASYLRNFPRPSCTFLHLRQPPTMHCRSPPHQAHCLQQWAHIFPLEYHILYNILYIIEFIFLSRTQIWQ